MPRLCFCVVWKGKMKTSMHSIVFCFLSASFTKKSNFPLLCGKVMIVRGEEGRKIRQSRSDNMKRELTCEKGRQIQCFFSLQPFFSHTIDLCRKRCRNCYPRLTCSCFACICGNACVYVTEEAIKHKQEIRGYVER